MSNKDINVVTVNDFDETQFDVSNTSGHNKVKIKFPKNTGVQSGELEGTSLKLTLQDGSEVQVDLSSLIPANKADIFLKSVEVQGTNLVFKTGVQGNTNSDQTIQVAISDLLETKVGDGIEGKGTTASPVKIKLNTQANGLVVNGDGLQIDKAQLKPIATVQLQDAFGEEIGYAFLSTERSAS